MPRRLPIARVPATASGSARRRSIRALLPAMALGFVLGGCSASGPMPEDELFREASLAFEEEAYATAIQSYKKMLEEYPFSDKAEVASLNIAFAHYMKQEYAQAIAAFNDFERLYPVSPLLPFISYSVGMCWLDQAKAGDRDPTPSDEALRQFTRVADEFPRTLYADLARFRQMEARENLAAHELVVGDYYRERSKPAAASARYRRVVSEFPQTENAARARTRLAELEVAAADKSRVEAAIEAETAAETGIPVVGTLGAPGTANAGTADAGPANAGPAAGEARPEAGEALPPAF